jgi:dTDP-4-dehydrorhamnose 3,5-epimerase
MLFHTTPIDGVTVIELQPRGDERGFFSRVFCTDEMAAAGLPSAIAQVNNSASRSTGTLRGLHYQLPPHAESKTVRCIKGSVFDVALDLREGSATFGRHYAIELSAGNRKMLHIPKGCAHGFLTLEPDSEVLYFVDAPYHAKGERGIRWNDPEFAIAWPFLPSVISDRDLAHPLFDRTRVAFENGVLDITKKALDRELVGGPRG